MLTSGAPPQNEFTDLIINEDEKTVWEGTEPPQGPKRKRKGVEQGGGDGECSCELRAKRKLLNSLQSFLNIKDNNVVFKKITDFI